MIYNLLPENLRSMNTDTFKNHLDIFLVTVPDQPTVTGLGRAALTNSLEPRTSASNVIYLDKLMEVQMVDITIEKP